MNSILAAVGGITGLLMGTWFCFLSNIVVYDHMRCCWKCLGIGCGLTILSLLLCRDIVKDARELALAGCAGIVTPFCLQSLLMFLL